MREIKIGSNEAGQRLDKLLRKYLPHATDGFIYKMLRKKNITLNSSKASGAEKLNTGDEVRLWLSEDTINKFSKDEEVFSYIKPLEDSRIIYQDKNILIYNKPAGELSQKAKEGDISAVEGLISYVINKKLISRADLKTFSPAFCNRLDRNTSGILLGGISLCGLQALSSLLHDRTIKKEYLCIVDGILEKQKLIEGYLYKDEALNKVIVTDKEIKDSKPIKTKYTPLYTEDNKTVLLVDLITGRSHQIRAHLSSIGHPILGDVKYGNADTNKKYKLKYQLLHAYRVTFPKIDGELGNLSNKMFIAKIPDGYKKIIRGYTWEPGKAED